MVLGLINKRYKQKEGKHLLFSYPATFRGQRNDKKKILLNQFATTKEIPKTRLNIPPLNFR